MLSLVSGVPKKKVREVLELIDLVLNGSKILKVAVVLSVNIH
jgi:hypothetical protein